MEDEGQDTAAVTSTEGHLKRWHVAPPQRAAGALARELGVPPLVAQVLCRRGLDRAELARGFLEPRLTGLHDPRQLAGCAEAAERLVAALRAGESVAVYGDYDVDGITATAIIYHVLKAAEPSAEVLRYVPHRVDDGYGLKAAAIEQLADEGARVIVSVDCGITALEPAAAAAARGVDLIVTDHHELDPGGELPRALALVHPGLSGYPFRGLCGAGVAYKLAWQVARTWSGSDRVGEQLRATLLDLLPLAALGTIADVVPLLDENRVIATCGLQRLKATRLVGLNALIDATRLRDEQIESSHVGFVIGPRLNACGRMGHARDAVDLLTLVDREAAEQIAAGLESVNNHRRSVERVIFEQAKQMVAARGDDRDEVRAIVLAHQGWHPGVIGVVCSRLVDSFGRPTVLLNIGDELATGSARSVDGFDIMEGFTACSEMLETFGGHAMAAGLSLRPERIDDFRAALDHFAAERLEPEDLTPKVDVDAEVSLGEVSLPVCRQLGRLAPFGRSNPAPMVLIRDVTLRAPPRRMGQEQRHLSLMIEQDGRTLRCVGWRLGPLAEQLAPGMRLDIVGELRINRFRGQTSVELDLSDLRWA